MSVNAFSQNFPPPQSKMVDDDKTGTDIWQTFFLQLWNRTGQANGIASQVATGVVAAGAAQGTAFALTLDWNDVATVAAGTGVIMPPMKAGQDIIIFNSGANALKVYPPAGMMIDALAINAAYSLPVAKLQIYRVFSLTQIRSMQLG